MRVWQAGPDAWRVDLLALPASSTPSATSAASGRGTPTVGSPSEPRGASRLASHARTISCRPRWGCGWCRPPLPASSNRCAAPEYAPGGPCRASASCRRRPSPRSPTSMSGPTHRPVSPSGWWSWPKARHDRCSPRSSSRCRWRRTRHSESGSSHRERPVWTSMTTATIPSNGSNSAHPSFSPTRSPVWSGVPRAPPRSPPTAQASPSYRPGRPCLRGRQRIPASVPR